MRNELVANILAPQDQQKAIKRELRLMAQLLAHQLHVNQGDNLVRILGNNAHRSNVEAIAYWLEERLEYIDEMKALQLDPLDDLRNELSKKLIHVEYGL
jgi:hypothetical protein